VVVVLLLLNNKKLVNDNHKMTGEEKDNNNIRKFSMFLSSGNGDDHRDSIIKGMVEGEARVLAATMTISELFSNRMKFKQAISDKIDEELQQFGLRVYNANIRELQDTKDSSYFKNTVKKKYYLKQKIKQKLMLQKQH